MKEEILFEVDSKVLKGTLHKALEEKAGALLISGGAVASYKDGYYPELQETLAAKGVTSFAFDFRGIGTSEGVFGETNLNTRVEDAKAALGALKNYSSSPILTVGTSMGGPVALRTVDESVSGLILVVPAAYSEEARSKNFGQDFSEAIRKPESWKNSPDFHELEKYEGSICLVYGTKDEVIPEAVFTKYADIVREKGGEVRVVESNGHKILIDAGVREKTQAEIVDFIMKTLV